MSEEKDIFKIADELTQAWTELSELVASYKEKFEQGWGFRSLGRKIRTKSVEAEKLAKQFRKLSIELDKQTRR